LKSRLPEHGKETIAFRFTSKIREARTEENASGSELEHPGSHRTYRCRA